MPRRNKGISREPLAATWYGMLRRCYDEEYKQYHRYGGRGIRVCRAWRESFWKFKSDMGPRPLNHTLERVNNDKGYGPKNCVWATRQEQSSNRTTSVKVTINGVTKTATEWANLHKESPRKIQNRIAKGTPVENLFEARAKQYTHKGKTRDLKYWSKVSGVHVRTLRYRIESQGMSLKEAMSAPVQMRGRRLQNAAFA